MSSTNGASNESTDSKLKMTPKTIFGPGLLLTNAEGTNHTPSEHRTSASNSEKFNGNKVGKI